MDLTGANEFRINAQGVDNALINFALCKINKFATVNSPLFSCRTFFPLKVSPVQLLILKSERLCLFYTVQLLILAVCPPSRTISSSCTIIHYSRIHIHHASSWVQVKIVMKWNEIDDQLQNDKVWNLYLKKSENFMSHDFFGLKYLKVISMQIK